MQSRQLIATAIAACSFSLVTLSTAQAAIVFANNPAPGDFFVNPGGSNQGQAVGATGWYYNNVRNSGGVGINDTLPRSGNGSAYFSSPSGAAKADIEFLANGTLFLGNYFANGSLGAFSSLSSFGYDWYRVGTSTNPAVQHPALRVLLDRDGDLTTIGDRGGLVFELAYNGVLSAPVDQWITNLVTANTKLWSFGFGLGVAPDGYGRTLSDWQTTPGPNSLLNLQNAVILGFSAGVGSGWVGAFTGAVDNINWTINNQTSTFNFEVQRQGTVPEPGTMALLGLGLAGLALTRRRRG